MESILLCIIQGKNAYFSILKDDSQIVYYSQLKYNTHLNIIDYPSKFFERLIELTNKFRTNKVRIAFVNEDYSIIPYDLEETKLEDLIIPTLDKDKRITHTEDAGYGVCKSFVPKEFADYFYQLDGDLFLTNIIASTGRVFINAQDGIHVHLLPDKIFIASVENSKVVFNNHFYTTGDLAAIYFVLLVINQLEVSAETPLVLHQISENSTLAKELKKQIQHRFIFPNSRFSINQDSLEAFPFLFAYESLS